MHTPVTPTLLPLLLVLLIGIGASTARPRRAGVHSLGYSLLNYPSSGGYNETDVTDVEVATSLHGPHTTETRILRKKLNNVFTYSSSIGEGTALFLHNPRAMLSVMAPPEGCTTRSTVEASAEAYNCDYAFNAGFFHVQEPHACWGNIISNGNRVQVDAVRNPNFGIRRDGSIEVGYMTSAYIKDAHFEQLVTGKVWLVRNGTSAVDASFDVEDLGHIQQGPRQFITITAPRTAVGHTADGRVMVVQLDGSEELGVGANLNEMAQLLIDMGAVNAINLDGGGSSTTVMDGLLRNYPSDTCTVNGTYETYTTKCARAVSSILCIRAKDDQLAAPKHQVADLSSSLAAWQALAILFAVLWLATMGLAVFRCKQDAHRELSASAAELSTMLGPDDGDTTTTST